MKLQNNYHRLLLIALIIVLSIIGCAGLKELEDLEYAKRKNTVEQYEAFIRKYPQSTHKDSVEQLIEERKIAIEKKAIEMQELSDNWKNSGDLELLWKLASYLYDIEAPQDEVENYLGKPNDISTHGNGSIVWHYLVNGLTNSEDIDTGITFDSVSKKVNGKFTYMKGGAFLEQFRN